MSNPEQITPAGPISEPTQLLVQRQRDHDAKFAIISIIISIVIIIIAIIAIIGNPYCN